MGGPVWFYQSNDLRVIFSCIATGIPTLVSAVPVYLLCVYEFSYTAKGKKAHGGEKIVIKIRTVTRLVENTAAETPLRDGTPNPEETAHYKNKTTLAQADGWVSMHRKKKMEMAVGLAGATFHLCAQAAARFASSSKVRRQEQAGCQPCPRL